MSPWGPGPTPPVTFCRDSEVQGQRETVLGRCSATPGPAVSELLPLPSRQPCELPRAIGWRPAGRSLGLSCLQSETFN